LIRVPNTMTITPGHGYYRSRPFEATLCTGPVHIALMVVELGDELSWGSQAACSFGSPWRLWHPF
jgi:hypothetical protein